MSPRRLEDFFKTCLQDLWRRLQRNNFSSSKTSWRRLARRKIVTLKTCWRYLQDISWKRFQDVLKTNKCLLGCLQGFFMTYQVNLFLLTRFWDVFNTFLRRAANTVIYRRICLSHTPDKFTVSVQNFSSFHFFNLLLLFLAAYRVIFRTWSNIYDGAFFAEILNDFKLLTIFAKKAPLQIFEWD